MSSHIDNVLRLVNKTKSKIKVDSNKRLQWKLSAYKVLLELTTWDIKCEELNYLLDGNFDNLHEAKTVSIGKINYTDTDLYFKTFLYNEELFVIFTTSRNDLGVIFKPDSDKYYNLPLVYCLVDDTVYDNIYDFEHITDHEGNDIDIKNSKLIITDFTYG